MVFTEYFYCSANKSNLNLRRPFFLISILIFSLDPFLDDAQRCGYDSYRVSATKLANTNRIENPRDTSTQCELAQAIFASRLKLAINLPAGRQVIHGVVTSILFF